MNNTTIDADLAGRYLADQLSVVERRQFEQRMIEDLSVMRDLEATATLKLGLVQLERTGRLRAVMGREPASWPQWLGAIAATVVMGMALMRVPYEPTVAMAGSATMLTSENGRPLRLSTSYPVYLTRSLKFDETIRLPSNREAIELKIYPEGPIHDRTFDVALESLNGDAPALFVEALPLSEGRYVRVFIDSSRFMPADYRLSISQTGQATQPGNTFLIRMRAESRSEELDTAK